MYERPKRSWTTLECIPAESATVAEVSRRSCRRTDRSARAKPAGWLAGTARLSVESGTAPAFTDEGRDETLSTLSQPLHALPVLTQHGDGQGIDGH
jgi:hypothetical protein